MARFYFHGSNEKTLDDKNRLQLPSELRDVIKKEQESPDLYVLLGDLPWTLNIYTEQGWADLIEALDARLADARRANDQEARMAETRFFAYTRKVVADKQWRIVLPDDLKKKAKLGNDVVVAGVRRRIQIHSKDRFERENAPDLTGEVWPEWTKFGALG